eukprot:scaffold10382_cov103-Cylindrotheca_fusiformis.AAC.3
MREHQKIKEQIKESQEELKKLKKQFPTFQEIASKTIHIPNETASSAHTATGHHTAVHQPMEIPKVTLNTDFWGSRSEFKFPRHINGEPGVNATLMNLLNAIIKALGLQSYIDTMLDVPVMDTAPDVSLITTQNKLLMGSVEGKKPAKTDHETEQIFGSGTQVAGE